MCNFADQGTKTQAVNGSMRNIKHFLPEIVKIKSLFLSIKNPGGRGLRVQSLLGLLSETYFKETKQKQQSGKEHVL